MNKPEEEIPSAQIIIKKLDILANLLKYNDSKRGIGTFELPRRQLNDIDERLDWIIERLVQTMINVNDLHYEIKELKKKNRSLESQVWSGKPE